MLWDRRSDGKVISPEMSRNARRLRALLFTEGNPFTVAASRLSTFVVCTGPRTEDISFSKGARRELYFWHSAFVTKLRKNENRATILTNKD